MISSMLLAATAQSTAPQYVGGTSAGFTGSPSQRYVSLTALTGGIATRPSANDVIIAFVAAASDGATNPILSITGFTVIKNTDTPGTWRTTFLAARKVSNGTEIEIEIPNGTGSTNNAGAAFIQVWRNIDTTTPMDVTATLATSFGSILADPPPITPVTAGAIIIIGGAGAHVTPTAEPLGPGSLNNVVSVSQAASYSVELAGGNRVPWVSGAYNHPAFTCATGDPGAGSSWAAVTIALRPKS